MTVIIKYKTQTKKRNKEWFARMEQKNINWAQWGGWFDSDGSIHYHYNKKQNKHQFMVVLRLKDRDPVELFSETFEASLVYHEHKTTTPNGNHYIAKSFISELRGERAIWFVVKIKKYILQKTKYLSFFLKQKNIEYQPYESKWSKEEWISYITTLIEGDGTFYNRHKDVNFFALYSTNCDFLRYISKELDHHNILKFGLPYKNIQKILRKDGSPSIVYKVVSSGTMQEKKLTLESLLPYMTMDRKRQNVLKTLEWIKERIEK